MPNFWFGIMLILVVAGYLNWLPSSGRSTYGIARGSETGFYITASLLAGNFAAAWDGVRHIILPAIALGTNMMGIIMRVTRSAVLEVMHEDFVAHGAGQGRAGTSGAVAARAAQRIGAGDYGRRP